MQYLWHKGKEWIVRLVAMRWRPRAGYFLCFECVVFGARRGGVLRNWSWRRKHEIEFMSYQKLNSQSTIRQCGEKCKIDRSNATLSVGKKVITAEMVAHSILCSLKLKNQKVKNKNWGFCRINTVLDSSKTSEWTSKVSFESCVVNLCNYAFKYCFFILWKRP